jgi:VWFA-related protein
MHPRTVTAFTLAVLLFTQTLPGQESTADSKDSIAVIHTTTREVLLDLVVRDKHHHAVTDLKPEEVTVYEDGVPQKVNVFRNVLGADQLQSEIAAAQAQKQSPSYTPTTAPSSNTTPATAPASEQNSMRQLNFVSIVFAQVAPLNLDFARQAIREFLKSDNLPNTYVTVYKLNKSLHLVQAYTNRQEYLAKAVDAATKGINDQGGPGINASVASAANAIVQANAEVILATPGIDQATAMAVQNAQLNPVNQIAQSSFWAANASSQDVSITLGSAILSQARLASGLRQSESLSNGMDAMDSLQALVSSEAKLPGRKVVLYLADGLTFPVNRRDVVDNLISYANRSGVSFYTVDTRGLTTEDPVLESRANQQRAAAESYANAASPRIGHHEDDDVQLTAVSNTQLAMRELAEATGGFSVANTNEIAGPMIRIMEDIRTHYELAYTPTSTNYDGHFRKIEIKITRPKVTVQTRKGYYALPELNGEPLQPYEAVALNAINARPAPSEFPYQVSLVKFKQTPAAVVHELAFEVPLAGLKQVANSKTHKTRVQAAVVALIHNSNGDIVGKISRDLEKEVPSADAAKLQQDRILYAENLVLPPGHYLIETAVTDEQAEKTSVKRVSAFVDSGKQLGISSVEVVNRVEPLNGPQNPFNPFEIGVGRIVPTFTDSVASGKPVGVYFIIYPAQGGVAEDTHVTLQLFHDGKEVARQPVTLPQPAADGSIPVLLQLSPDPGQCDIKVTAQQGTLMAQSTLAVKVE